MDHLGIDVHKRESQISILAEGGEVVEQRIRTGFNVPHPRELTACAGRLASGA